MVVPELPQELFDAGAEYLAQLRKLGLHPEGFLWLYRVEDRQFVLTIIWSGIDKHGPLSMSKLLFKAFNNSLLPREIDPFHVDVRSPNEFVAHMLMDHIPKARAAGGSYMQMDRSISGTGADAEVVYRWEDGWIYHLADKPRSVHQVRQDWNRFRQNVERLAA